MNANEKNDGPVLVNQVAGKPGEVLCGGSWVKVFKIAGPSAGVK